jgi:hypothetical protein
MFTGGSGGGQTGLKIYQSGPNCGMFAGGIGGGQTALIIWQGGPFCAPKVSTKIFLQGSFNSGTGLMNTTLNSKGLLPTAQPYNTPGYNYTGKETVAPGFFTTHTDIVDWVLLELRDSTNPTTVVAQHAALVKSDGTVVDTNGVAPVAIANIKAGGRYYVAVRHRNHLGIRTPYSQTLSASTPFVYDFTFDQLQAYNSSAITTNKAMKDLGPSKFGLWMGNIIPDDQVSKSGPSSTNDMLKLQSYLSGGDILNKYHPGDVNLDGSAKKLGLSSQNDFQIMSSFFYTLGVNTITAHF